MGGYVGYIVAPEKVVEVSVFNQIQPTQTENANWNMPDYESKRTYTENEFGFRFNIPNDWGVTDISDSQQFAVPEDGLKHVLIKKYDDTKVIRVSVVPKNKLGGQFGCYGYVYIPSQNNYLRQDDSVTDRCIAEEIFKSIDNQVLNSNFVVADIPALKNYGINPASILVPLSSEYGLNISAGISWGDTPLGELDPESLSIINSLTQTK